MKIYSPVYVYNKNEFWFIKLKFINFIFIAVSALPNEEFVDVPSAPIISINDTEITYNVKDLGSIDCNGDRPVKWDSEVSEPFFYNK